MALGTCYCIICIFGWENKVQYLPVDTYGCLTTASLLSISPSKGTKRGLIIRLSRKEWYKTGYRTELWLKSSVWFVDQHWLISSIQNPFYCWCVFAGFQPLATKVMLLCSVLYITLSVCESLCSCPFITVVSISWGSSKNTSQSLSENSVTLFGSKSLLSRKSIKFVLVFFACLHNAFEFDTQCQFSE